ncbi:MAG: SPOR domain-containing protein [Clostridia bacterium]|nr:SPOR domain-containing protein [Clostridia bacterium]
MAEKAKTYKVLAGSYKSIKTAKDKAKMLEAEGFKGFHVVPDGVLYQVAAEVATKEEAEKLIQDGIAKKLHFSL